MTSLYLFGFSVPLHWTLAFTMLSGLAALTWAGAAALKKSPSWTGPLVTIAGAAAVTVLCFFQAIASGLDVSAMQFTNEASARATAIATAATLSLDVVRVGSTLIAAALVALLARAITAARNGATQAGATTA